MSFFQDLANPSHTWSDRISFILDTSAIAGAAAVLVSLDLSKYQDFDWLWDLIEGHVSAGDDLRITTADGGSLVSQAEVTTAINTTTRTGVIKFDFTTVDANVMHVCHLYLGNASASAAWGTVVNSTAVTAYLLQDATGGGYPVTPIAGQVPKSGATRELIAKHPNAEPFLGFTIDDLQPRCEPSAGLLIYEEVSHLDFDVQLVDVSQASMFDLDSLRLGTCPQSIASPLVRVTIKGGTDGSDYGVEVIVTTTLGRVLVRRVGVSVRQTLE